MSAEMESQMRIDEITNQARKIIKRLNEQLISYAVNPSDDNYSKMLSYTTECRTSTDPDIKLAAEKMCSDLDMKLIEILSRNFIEKE